MKMRSSVATVNIFTNMEQCKTAMVKWKSFYVWSVTKIKKSIKITVTIKHIAGGAIEKDATGDIGK